MTNAAALDRVLGFDRKIRYCGLVDEKGKVVAGRMREGTESLQPGAEDERLFIQISLAVSMDRSWDRFFGRTSAIAIMKEKVAIFIFALPDTRAVVVATEPDLAIAKMKKLGELVDTSAFEA
jgi:hypothetical protein